MLDLPLRDVERDNAEYGPDRIFGIDRARVGQPLRDFGDEFLAIAALGRHLRRFELVVINAANQQRQLSSQVRRKIDAQPVTELVQDGRQRLPGDLLVRPEIRHDLLEPHMGGFQCLVEDFEAVRAHGLSPSTRLVRYAAWRTNRRERAFHDPARFKRNRKRCYKAVFAALLTLGSEGAEVVKTNGLI